ncbi:hypothetical protein [Paludisphaera mucosa]|uniref:Uncharacterized protein n=1 Tax=Paludisphaera mucosa TaxID=3030827 RepID=A0ABT6F956_9BACT|nr:hypothetical protein [Paludisphaera mucosa]MDG3004107.1 hypothetical protein [Paludisphaera mucosa]
MHTKSSRRLLAALVVAAAASIVLTESAQAQQTGLLPLHPIKRRRVPCSQEDPVYRIYKDQYFGYHPTLWRRFPSGWGAPSPEAPDAKAAFKELPLQPPEWAAGDDQGQGPDQGGDAAGPGPADPAKPKLPTPPNEDDRSPFEMDDKANAAPPAAAPPRQGVDPAPPADAAPAAPANDPNRSPFDTPNPRTNAPRPKPPELDSPTGPTASRSGRATEVDAAEAGGPLLAMPDTSVDEGYEAPALGGPARGHDHDHDHQHPATGAARPQQAPRRNRLAAMMDNLGWNVSRR